MRLLLGQLQPAAGSVKVGVTVKVAHLSQEVAEINTTERVLESVERIAKFVTIGKKEHTASSMLERFGFTGNRQWAPVGDLSGGERRRLQLLRLLMGEPNVLFLDEPTNDLDIETLTQLEDLLDGWPGTLLVVSHDRYFLERDHRHRPRPARRRPAAHAAERRRRVHRPARRRHRRRARAAPAKPASAAAPKAAASAADARAAKKELTRIERRWAQIEAAEKDLHEQLATHASDYAKVAELDGTLRELAAERGALEEEWLAAAEAAEA